MKGACSVGVRMAIKFCNPVVLRCAVLCRAARSAKAYDDAHITKPARTSFNVPMVMNDGTTPNDKFVSQVGPGHLHNYCVSVYPVSVCLYV